MHIAHARLMLVDDDPTAIHVMRQMLDDCASLRFALSGEAALLAAHQQRPDLIVLDAKMPGMSGLDVCAALKADPHLRDVPIIIATGSSLSDAEVAALKAGATDFVSKPLARESFRERVATALGAARKSAEQSHGRASLLVVDDDVTAIQVLRNSVDQLGSVYFALSGETALSAVTRVRPDLLLLDVHMPMMDGFSVCQSLKADPALRLIPVVFVTRFSDPDTEARAFAIGAADFISKPYVPAVLHARIRNLLDLQRRSVQDLREAGEHWRRIGDARLADILRTASDAILTCRPDHEILLANPAAVELFGLADELVGHSLNALLPGAADVVRSARDGAVTVGLTRPDGTTRSLEVRVSGSSGAINPLFTLVLRDVTDRLKLEAESRARALAEAERDAKTRMIGYVSHELANPLNGVLGCMQILRDLETDRVSPRKSWLDNLEKSAGSMKRLLDDLLDLARSEHGQLSVSLSEVGLRGAVDQALLEIAAAAKSRALTLRAPDDGPEIWLKADPQRLQQCLSNLLTNALKYNRVGGWIEVQVERNGPRARIFVRDGGIGMDAGQLAQMFQPFNRLGRERGPVRGTGIGLVITRELVHAMGGELSVESSIEGGSCFTIELPAAEHLQ